MTALASAKRTVQTNLQRTAAGNERAASLEAVMSSSNFSLRTCVALVVAAFCLSSSAYAQFNASLTGTVQDSTGAIVPNATVTLTNLGTQQTQKTVSADSGAYRFSELAP